jgi:hypothetical protein
LFSTEEQAHSEEWLSTLEDNVGKSTFTTIRHSLTVEQCSTVWSYIFGLLGILVAVTVIVLLGSAFLTRHFLTLLQRVTQWVTALLPASVRALM